MTSFPITARVGRPYGFKSCLLQQKKMVRLEVCPCSPSVRIRPCQGREVGPIPTRDSMGCHRETDISPPAQRAFFECLLRGRRKWVRLPRTHQVFGRLQSKTKETAPITNTVTRMRWVTGKQTSSCYFARVPEWLKGADCKSVVEWLRGFKSLSWHHCFEAQEWVTSL